MKVLALLSTVAIMFNSISNAAHSILNFGAIPDKTDLGAVYGNADAFYSAVMFAHNHERDKEVLIPANYTFYMMPV